MAKITMDGLLSVEPYCGKPTEREGEHARWDDLECEISVGTEDGTLTVIANFGGRNWILDTQDISCLDDAIAALRDAMEEATKAGGAINYSRDPERC